MMSFITFCVTLSKTMLAVFKLTPSAKRKCFCVQARIKITQQSKKQVKFKNIASRLTQNIFTTLSLKALAFHIPLSDLPCQRSLLSTYGPHPVSSLSKIYQLNQGLSLKGPMTAMWSSDHSAIYRNLYLCLAIANNLSLAIGSTRVDWKVSLMQLRPQINSYNLMHKKES
jgi:hypothetical protein